MHKYGWICDKVQGRCEQFGLNKHISNNVDNTMTQCHKGFNDGLPSCLGLPGLPLTSPTIPGVLSVRKYYPGYFVVGYYFSTFCHLSIVITCL